MNLTDFEDETKFKKYIKEIYDNDTWLKHKKQLEDEGLEWEDVPFSHNSIEEGQLYLMLDYENNIFYYYHPTEWDREKTGLLIYVPTEEFKKNYRELVEYQIYYEPVTSLPKYVVSLTKILIITQFMNWDKNPWSDVK